ncbi:MAG: dephospho-CoA kinase [Bacteroidota bacterium]|nr:dephospho-CoA kinase [Odoribacter sp.]MDP3641787.1 dephospho-CoA kinase [Bacteroidota bacterium]
MIKVGITGGIGSGKSTVCKVFRVLGIPVFEADSTAKQLMNTDPSLREQLIQLFGTAVYLPNLTIDRKYLAGIVFSNASLLRKLNEIVHPAVRKSFNEWCLIQHSPYVIHEAAILFESGFYKLMDKTIAVVTDETERIDRVVKRDYITVEMVRQRIKNQWNDEQRIKLADFVIGNNNNELIIPQIIEIDKKIRTNG